MSDTSATTIQVIGAGVSLAVLAAFAIYLWAWGGGFRETLPFAVEILCTVLAGLWVEYERRTPRR